MDKMIITITDDKKQEILTKIRNFFVIALPLLVLALMVWIIGGVKASNTALEYANLTRGDVSYVSFELDVDDLIPQYEVTWYQGRAEVEHSVHAFTGDIINLNRR